jgi:2-polyprenyl-6-methoxyphenol hydroxylase-like FAD-dependent oxidoreductase
MKMNWKVTLLWIFGWNFCIFSSKMIEKVCIIGGGVTGLTVATVLQRKCPNINHITVLDTRKDILAPQIGGGLQLTGGGMVLKQIGLESELKRIAQPFQAVVCRNSKDITKARHYKSIFQAS